GRVGLATRHGTPAARAASRSVSAVDSRTTGRMAAPPVGSAPPVAGRVRRRRARGGRSVVASGRPAPGDSGGTAPDSHRVPPRRPGRSYDVAGSRSPRAYLDRRERTPVGRG